ncbi:transcriptional regulator [Jeotgalibacillus haloalkalitolerans]|uniref:Transcriptional regulator n=1 Tax=Jeotgalibacillus haloalkalitolerans TaxID=3104292 RepID=A0ABU5KLS6_9BACL|nr:transcriptional regulator [Jeotgalibacillus sp. HH7-29]MDZ5712227.1 transcriptional regulator [Jeotgalibacillus sp. HH7-29]
MREQLMKYQQQNHTVKMIYMDKSGQCSERKIRIRNLHNTSFTAFCFKRGAVRTFQYDNVLSIVPVIKREKMVI